MTGSRIARSLARIINVVVLIVSGVYLLVYLYRWEWNRAVISGFFFIAAEIALATTLILAELRRRPIGDGAPTERTITRANAARKSQTFDWLTSNDRLGVFIPVLLGAGVLLSAFAYIVERVAGAFAGPTVDRHTARLIDLDLPLGSHPGSSPGGPPKVARLLWSSVSVMAIVLLVWAGLDVLADATQSRLEEKEPSTGTTRVTLAIHQKNLPRSDLDLAEAFWIVCRSVATPDAELDRIRNIGGDQVELVIHPAMGELRRRRVFGCLQDAVIDRVRVVVVAWSVDGISPSADEPAESGSAPNDLVR